MLTVNPEYQRGAVWKDPQQKKLIDSIFRSYPLPLIYLHHKKKMVAGMQHQDGGLTTMENGVSVHKDCHPKGQKAIEFYNLWVERKKIIEDLKIQEQLAAINETKFSPDMAKIYKIVSVKENVKAFGKY